MSSKVQALVKTAADNIQLQKELAAAHAKVAAFEAQEQAEALLLEMVSSPDGDFAPTGIHDFIEKRAEIVRVGVDTARAAVKLASRQSFMSSGGIGDPHVTADNQSTVAAHGDSKADSFLEEFLAGSTY